MSLRAESYSGNLGGQFPCLEPMFSSMRHIADRLLTFYEGEGWNTSFHPSHFSLAEAGLFYTGTSDRVKCWYCGGGLENWEQGDDP